MISFPKKELLLASFMFLALPPNNNFGNIPTNVPEEKRLEIKQRIEEKRQAIEQRKVEIREKVEEKRASQAARLTEKRKERIDHFFDRLSLRLQALIGRLETLIERIESRVDRINENNEDVDTTDVEEKLTEAKALLAEAELELVAAEANLDTVLESEDPKAAFEVIRDTIVDIRGNLREVHLILVQTIGDIKGLRIGVDTATQSADTE